MTKISIRAFAEANSCIESWPNAFQYAGCVCKHWHYSAPSTSVPWDFIPSFPLIVQNCAVLMRFSAMFHTYHVMQNSITVRSGKVLSALYPGRDKKLQAVHMCVSRRLYWRLTGAGPSALFYSSCIYRVTMLPGELMLVLISQLHKNYCTSVIGISNS